VNWSIGVKIWVGFGTALLLLLIIGAASYQSIDQLVADADDEAHSSEVLDSLSVLDTELKNAELAERDMLLTGSETARDAYQRATTAITQRLSAANALTRDEAALQKQIADFDAALNRRLIMHRSLIEQRDSAKLQKIAGLDEAERLSEDLDAKLGVAETAERARLEERREAADASGARARQVITVVSILSLVALLLVAIYIVRSITVPVRASVETLSAATAQLNAASEEHRRTVSEQSAAVNETTATAAELAASQKQVMQTAATVSQVGVKAADAVDSGQQALDRTLHGLNDIKAKTEATSQRISALSDRSQQVGKIIVTIREIAEQTNLLALNAAIEAARAGDQGRGFGVVANEVRKLAERTKRSTEDITELIEGMQNSTSSAVMATEETLKSVEDGNREAFLARQVFANISEQVSDTSDAIKQIHVSCQQQDGATGQIAAAMNQINAGMKQTVVAVEQTAASSSGLKDTAQRLKRLVG